MSPEVRRRRRGRWTRRLRRFVRTRPRVAVAVGVLGLLVLVGLWCGWRAWTIAHDLDTASKEAQVMRAALLRGDAKGARNALEEFQDAASSASSHAGGPSWWLVERVPLIGDDARGVHTVSDVLDDLGRKGLPPIIGAADQVTGGDFQPHDHRFPLARIAATREPARQSKQAFAAAYDRLDEVDSSGFVGPFRSRFDELRGLVRDARSTLGSTYRAARMLPDLLGAHHPRNYLMVLENNAEMRSMGGLAGSVSLVHARHGAVHIVSQDDMGDLVRKPDMRLTAQEEQLFGPQLLVSGVNATMTPDTPRAAELVRGRWTATHGGRVDGVYFVDPVAVSYLLQGVGPVAVPGYPPVAAGNVVPAVEHQIYLQTTDRHAQSDYQNAVAKAVFNAFADGDGDPVTAIRGLATGVAEGRVRMHSFVASDQDQIAGTALAGEFGTRPSTHPEVGIYINDSTESKMSYYLDYSVNVAARSCGGGYQEIVATLTLTNDTPPDVASLPVTVTGWGDRTRKIKRGSQYVVAYLTSPIGGTVVSLDDDGTSREDPAQVPYRGRKVATVGVHLAPGASHTIEWVMRSGLRQTGSLHVSVTPGTQPGTASGTVPSAC